MRVRKNISVDEYNWNAFVKKCASLGQKFSTRIDILIDKDLEDGETKT